MINRITPAFIAAIVAASIASPAFAQAHRHHGNAGAERPAVRQNDRIRGYDAFGMDAIAGARSGGNNPAATGGGSLGYNQKLLEY